jgi:hypothetical protein
MVYQVETTFQVATDAHTAEFFGNEDHPAIVAAKEAALTRALRYNVDALRYHKQLGFCWLVAGGPKNQTYRSEARIIADWLKEQQELASQIQIINNQELVIA